MIPRRWDDVERIVEAALVLAPHQRASLVADACGGDTVLRAEVESLLAQEAAAEDLLSTPAAALLATSGDAGTFVGRQFGTYAVVELLGVGTPLALQVSFARRPSLETLVVPTAVNLAP